MYTICFYNHKGGVGKTSVTGAIAGELIMQGKKVLMIDTDSQGNLSTQFMNGSEIENELADYLYDDSIGLDNVIRKTRYDNLYIIPTRKLSNKGQLDKWVQREAGVETAGAISKMLRNLQKYSFDYVLFDMPPSYTELDKMVLKAADEVIPILQIAKTSMDGLVDFYVQLKKIKDDSEKPICKKLIFNQYEKAKAVQKALLPNIEALKSSKYLIPTDQVFKKAELQCMAIQEIGPKKETSEVLNQIIKDIQGNK